MTQEVMEDRILYGRRDYLPSLFGAELTEESEYKNPIVFFPERGENYGRFLFGCINNLPPSDASRNGVMMELRSSFGFASDYREIYEKMLLIVQSDVVFRFRNSFMNYHT